MCIHFRTKQSWKERLCTLTKNEFTVIKGDKDKDTNTTERRTEHHVLGDRPKIIVGAGGAPGHAFLLVCGGRNGVAKEIPLGAATADILQAWVSAFLNIPGVPAVEFAQESQPLANVTAALNSNRGRAEPRSPLSGSPPKLNSPLGLSLGLDGLSGKVVVLAVEPRSSASRSGLVREGQIVTHVDNEKVSDAATLASATAK
eukprot:3049900-Rhodomonas_salina.1